MHVGREQTSDTQVIGTGLSSQNVLDAPVNIPQEFELSFSETAVSAGENPVEVFSSSSPKPSDVDNCNSQAQGSEGQWPDFVMSTPKMSPWKSSAPGPSLQTNPPSALSWAQVAARPFQSTWEVSQGPHNPSLPSVELDKQLCTVAGANDDWMLDPADDFALFDESMTRFLQEPEPYVGTQTLHVGTWKPVEPSQLLIPVPESEVDTSSTSSGRRSKREIMEGNQGPYKCQHCQAGFTNADDRRHHEFRVHLPYASRPWPCPHCNYRAVLKKDLNRHLPKHGDRAANAQYLCSVSGCKYSIQGFVRKDHYNRHMEIHKRADSAIQMSRMSRATSARTSS